MIANHPGINIREFEPGDAAAFAALNQRWIEDLFDIEESDSKQLGDPQGAIISAGGAIVMALEEGQAIGTGAVVPAHHAPDSRKWWEIIKMATDPAAQGKGVGKMVLNRLILIARERGADALWLETNDALGSAVRLYESVGFRKLTCEELWPSPYGRCNVQMTMEIYKPTV
ncbi:MAG: GNAT family N-acetyltransferase [Pseudomonadota bacterium]